MSFGIDNKAWFAALLVTVCNGIPLGGVLREHVLPQGPWWGAVPGAIAVAVFICALWLFHRMGRVRPNVVALRRR